MRDHEAIWQSSVLSVTAGGRSGNEDAWLDLPDHGVWAVADGMGGHRMGATASRSVIEAVSAAILPLGPATSDAVFAARGAAANAALLRAHDYLVALGQSLAPPGIVGTTVVLLLATATRARLLWIGDSRAYLMRSLALHRVTQDHARIIDAARPGDSETPLRPRQVLTQAIGAATDLSVGSIDIGLDPHDRLLLCSDGFYKVFDDHQIAEHMAQPASFQTQAIGRVLEIQAPTDDLTMIAIERIRPASP